MDAWIPMWTHGCRRERLGSGMSALVWLGVFVAAATPWLEVLLVVPAAIVVGLPAAPTVVIASAGNIVTLVALVLVGDRVRSAWRRRRTGFASPCGTPEAGGPSSETHGPSSQPGGASSAVGGSDRGRDRRARRVLVRYGLPGLAVLGPLLTGVHVAALVALGAGAPRRQTAWWLSAGVIAWALLAALATIVGIEWLVDPEALPRLPGTDAG